MSRQSDILLGAKAWSTGNENAAQLDPLFGGQFGYASNPTEWLSAQAYLPRHLIPIVLETPKFFQNMPDPQKWVEAYRVFWEKHCRTIEGLKAGLNVDTADHQFGGGGEVFEEFTDVKRERSTLSAGLVEKYGNVWQSYFEKYIMYGMMHPETKTPLISTRDNAPNDLLADWYAGTIAFIEPNAAGNKVIRTWISANVWPKGTGPIEGKMDKTSALNIKDLSLEFTSLTFINEGTRALGQELLDAVVKSWANPQLRKSFITEVAADVAAVTKSYAESVTNIAANRVGDIV